MGIRAKPLKFNAICALAAVAIGFFASGVHAQCSDSKVDIRGDWGQVSFQAEVADSPQEHSRGLMFRDELAPLAGMLFVYEKPQAVAFWMRNTLIPLDMLFADAAGKIVRIHENAVPLDETPIPGGDNIQFVFEISGGMSATLGIATGSELRHPSISEEFAAWPCN